MRFALRMTYVGGQRKQPLQHVGDGRDLEIGLQVEVKVGLALLTLLVHKEGARVLGELRSRHPSNETAARLELGCGKILSHTLKMLKRHTSNVLIRHLHWFVLPCRALFCSNLMKFIFRDGNFLFFDWPIYLSIASPSF